MNFDEISQGLTESMTLCEAELRRQGFTEKEVTLAKWLGAQMITGARIHAEANEVHTGRLMACVIAFFNTIDQRAEQDTARILGHNSPGGKN